jgi:deoxyribonuclease V
MAKTKVDSQMLEAFDFLQEKLKSSISYKNLLKKINTIAGCDVYYNHDFAKAVVCVIDSRLQLIEKIEVTDRVEFPYLPGYLLFREAPIILKAISKLKLTPDSFFFDGNGILHPRNMGLATFLGIILKKPTIGCAKNLLLGKYNPVGVNKGEFSYIKYNNKILGAALRTRREVKEIYVSIGWGVTLKKAIEVVVATSKYRIPEPLRLAHLYSKSSQK